MGSHGPKEKAVGFAHGLVCSKYLGVTRTLRQWAASKKEAQQQITKGEYDHYLIQEKFLLHRIDIS
jgi:hypothetical protein